MNANKLSFIKNSAFIAHLIYVQLKMSARIFPAQMSTPPLGYAPVSHILWGMCLWCLLPTFGGNISLWSILHQFSVIALNGLQEDDNIRLHSIEGAQEPRDKNNYFIHKEWILNSCLCGDISRGPPPHNSTRTSRPCKLFGGCHQEG